MNNRAPVFIRVLSILILVSCGGGEGGDGGPKTQSGFAATCNTADKGLCYEWVADSPTDSVKEWCDSVNGAFASNQSCPTANRIGECKKTMSATRVNYTYAYSPIFTAELAQTVCKNTGGEFKPL